MWIFFYNKKKFRDFQNFLAHSSVFRENWYFFFCALSQLIIQKFYLIIHNKYFFSQFRKKVNFKLPIQLLNYSFDYHLEEKRKGTSFSTVKVKEVWKWYLEHLSLFSYKVLRKKGKHFFSLNTTFAIQASLGYLHLRTSWCWQLLLLPADAVGSWSFQLLLLPADAVTSWSF